MILNKHQYKMMTKKEEQRFLSDMIKYITLYRGHVSWVKFLNEEDSVKITFEIFKNPPKNDDDGPGNQRLPEVTPVSPLRGGG